LSCCFSGTNPSTFAPNQAQAAAAVAANNAAEADKIRAQEKQRIEKEQEAAAAQSRQVLKLTCWVRGSDPSTVRQKSARGY
jgi:hypothetical protein